MEKIEVASHGSSLHVAKRASALTPHIGGPSARTRTRQSMMASGWPFESTVVDPTSFALSRTVHCRPEARKRSRNRIMCSDCLHRHALDTKTHAGSAQSLWPVLRRASRQLPMQHSFRHPCASSHEFQLHICWPSGSSPPPPSARFHDGHGGADPE